MKKIVEKVLSPQVFAIAYLPWLALNMMTVVNLFDFTRYILVLFAAWGVAVCAKTFLFCGKREMFSKKGPWLDKFMAVLIAFIAICLISQVINFKYGGAAVIGRLAYFALCILVLYSQYKSTVGDYKKTLLYASRGLCAVITPAMIASLIMFFNLYHGVISWRGGNVVHLGVHENRLYGVFTSANVGGMYALILIWCAVINIYYLKKSKLKPLWIAINALQILIAMTYISVALSRGTYLSGAAFLIVFLLFRAPLKVESRLKVWMQAAIRAVSVAVCLFIAINMFSALRVGCVEIAQYTVSLRPAPKPQKPDLPEQSPEELPEELPDTDGETDKILDDLSQGFEGRVESQTGNKDITNKRMDIWKGHLSLMKGKNLLFGVNNPYNYYTVEAASGTQFTHEQFIWIDWAKGNMHNGYLQILVHCGVVALAVFVLFLALSFAGCTRYVIATVRGKEEDAEKYKLFSLAMPMVVNILVNNVTETNMVLMGANFFQAVFWFAAGLTVFCITKKTKEM